MKKPLESITVLAIALGLTSTFYLSKSDRPFDLVDVKFCPKTANIGRENHQESQIKLDDKYCRRSNKMLKEVWQKQQFESPLPLPDDSFVVRDIHADDSGVWWFLASPVFMGVGYLSWSKKLEIAENSAHFELEGFKTQIKLTGVSTRQERSFKTDMIGNTFDRQRVKAGLISVDAIADRLQKQTEITDKTHTTTLKQFDLAMSEMNKGIAENTRDTHKANKEVNKSPKNTPESSSERIDSMIEMLKTHEDGWLWKIIDNQKPIWVLGEAGSGKSTLAASIVMLRQYLFKMPLYQLIDAHAGDNLRKAWKYLKPELIARTEEEISGAFEDARERWLDRINNQPDKQPQQLLVDEFTNYSESDIIKEPAKKFVKASLSDPRKAEERLVCIAHFFTNTAVGGSDGTAKGRARGTIQIDRKTADGKTPLAVATINGLNNSEGEAETDKKVTIPSWLNPVEIHKHFT